MSLIRPPFPRCRRGLAGLLLLLGGAAVLPVSGQAQELALRGFIVDAETGEPLPGAHVVLGRVGAGETLQGAAADGNGYYHLPDLSPGRYVLRVSYVGHRSLRDTLRLTGREETVTRTYELIPVEQALEEVVITDRERGATTQEAGLQRVAPEDIARVPTPSISGDLASYLQSMPGVVSVGDRGGQLFIRGGTPDQNLILMDKMQVFRPFHIVGFYSAFPEELISDAEIYAGGFPARYSGRLSSVIDVEMRGGNQQHLEAAATMGPFLTGLRAEGPLNDDGLSLLGAARFSQIEHTAPLILGQEQPLTFNDQFVKLQNTYETGRCGVTGLHTYDRGSIDPASDDVFRWTNVAVGGRCVGVGAGSEALVDVSFSTSYVQNAVGERASPEREADFLDVATKVKLTRPLGGGTEVRGGGQIHLYELTYSLDEKFQGLRFGKDDWLSISGYFESTLPLGSNVELRPGMAVTFPLDFSPAFEPRLRASWRPFGSEDQEVNVAVGRYRQTVVGLSDERDLGSVFTAWVPAPLEQGRPAAWHAILGWRQQIGPFGLTAEGYYKDLHNLAVPIWSTIARFTTSITAAEGTSWGFDLRAEYEHGPLYAYLGYGFSWTRYTASQDNFSTWFGTDIRNYHPPHDRRHELNAVLSADFGHVKADLRWQFGAGLPYTKPFGFDAFIRLRELRESPGFYGTPRLLYEKPYRDRLPAYHRLDVSLKRTFSWDAVELTAKAGAINLYDRQNLFYFDLFTQRRVNQLPLVPYLALEIVMGE